MKNKISFVFFIFLLAISARATDPFTAVALCAEQQDDQDIAQRFFPQQLAQDSRDDEVAGYPARRYVSTAHYQNWIFAAYSNGYIGAVRVIRSDAPALTVIAEDVQSNMAGSACSVELADLDAQGNPEVLVSFSDQHGIRGYWIYRWDGQKLNLMSETEHSSVTGIDSDITDPLFVDLDGDGKTELISRKFAESDVQRDGTRTVTDILQVYKLANGVFAPGDRLLMAQKFERGKREPRDVSARFTVDDPSAQYALRVVNVGTPHAVGTVTINGKRIISQEDFKTNPKFIGPRTISTAEGSNTVNVRLTGSPGSAILVVIEPAKLD